MDSHSRPNVIQRSWQDASGFWSARTAKVEAGRTPAPMHDRPESPQTPAAQALAKRAPAAGRRRSVGLHRATVETHTTAAAGAGVGPEEVCGRAGVLPAWQVLSGGSQSRRHPAASS